MKTKLTLQEKLRDLRDEKKLTLSDLAGATGIPLSTLQRTEGQDDVRVGYQDIAALAKFYGVSMDYLFGLTDNRQHRGIEIDRLYLSDEAIAELQSGRLNNRILGEIITHPDFAGLLVALEVYVDRTISDGINTVNNLYKAAASEVSRQYPSDKRDEHLAALKELDIDPDDYLRFLLSQRFDKITKSIYDDNQKTVQSEAESSPAQTVGKQLVKFNQIKKRTGSAEQAVLSLWADQLGIDLDKIPDAERKIIIKFLSRSKYSQQYKKGRRRR